MRELRKQRRTDSSPYIELQPIETSRIKPAKGSWAISPCETTRIVECASDNAFFHDPAVMRAWLLHLFLKNHQAECLEFSLQAVWIGKKVAA